MEVVPQTSSSHLINQETFLRIGIGERNNKRQQSKELRRTKVHLRKTVHKLLWTDTWTRLLINLDLTKSMCFKVSLSNRKTKIHVRRWLVWGIPWISSLRIRLLFRDFRGEMASFNTLLKNITLSMKGTWTCKGKIWQGDDEMMALIRMKKMTLCQDTSCSTSNVSERFRDKPTRQKILQPTERTNKSTTWFNACGSTLTKMTILTK